jgi:hypothetical protein
VLATGELATLDDIRHVVVAFRNQTPCTSATSPTSAKESSIARR